MLIVFSWYISPQKNVVFVPTLYQIRRGQRLKHTVITEGRPIEPTGQRGARAIIIILHIGMDPINICNIVHPVDAGRILLGR